jgi:WD40 repeat protein
MATPSPSQPEPPEEERPRLVVQQGQANNIRSVEFSSDGKTMLTGGGDGSVSLWDMATGLLIRRINGGINGVLAAYGSDGLSVKGLYYWDGVKTWSVKTGAMLSFTRTAAMFEPAVSSDWTLEAGCSPRPNSLNNAIVCDARTGKILRELIGHTGRIDATAFSPDGRFIATGSAAQR